MDLSPFSRIPLGHMDTPLEFMPRLTEALGGPQLYIKRDDCTGLSGGGNKTRKLEFLMAEALEKGADTVITAGAVQSNHARQTAAAAAKVGLKCELLLEVSLPDAGSDYLESGNLFLDKMFDARLHDFPFGGDMEVGLEQLAQKISDQGGTPYIIPVGGSNALGGLGYVKCAEEIIAQADQLGIAVDHVVHGTGSAGTQAGLVAGFQASHVNISVLGICVSRSGPEQEEKIYPLAQEIAALIGAEGTVERNDIKANGDYFGEGYAMVTESMKEALSLTARLEGILLDPVYSGKAMAGMIDLVRKGHFKKNETVVFVHTGGSPALFAYHRDLLIQDIAK